MDTESISPAIVNIHVSSKPLEPEQKQAMLEEIEQLILRSGLIMNSEATHTTA